MKDLERYNDPAWLPRVIFLQGRLPSGGQRKPSAFVAAQEQSLRDLGVDVVPFFVEGTRFLKYPQSIRRFRRIVRESDADVIHAHFVYNGVLALFQRRLPTVISFLGGDVFVEQIRDVGSPVRAGITYAMTQCAAYAADEVIVKSESMRNRVWRKRHVHVVPNGVDLGKFAPAPRDDARRELGLALETPYVLFASAPRRPEKDFALAERAMDVVRGTHPNAEMFVLEGVPHTRVPLVLSAADVLLFTSKSEGSPNVVKEAMACNLPVVSVDVGDVRTVVEGTEQCAVLASRSAEELGAEVSKVLAAGRRSNGRERMARFDSRIVARQLIDLYREAILRR